MLFWGGGRKGTCRTPVGVRYDDSSVSAYSGTRCLDGLAVKWYLLLGSFSGGVIFLR